ncbi:MAG: hypothetical protein Q4P31_02645 [Andreesenia angusta]|nr:hypothetical protein [Andreesenia angusta]
MKKRLIYRFLIPIVFLLIFSLGLNAFYSNREIAYMPAPLIFYDMFMPYLTGLMLSLIGKSRYIITKTKLIFMAIINIIVFLIEIIILSQTDKAIAIELHILISVCISYVINATLLELEFKK